MERSRALGAFVHSPDANSDGITDVSSVADVCIGFIGTCFVGEK